jgi:hypothetical protein
LPFISVRGRALLVLLLALCPVPARGAEIPPPAGTLLDAAGDGGDIDSLFDAPLDAPLDAPPVPPPAATAPPPVNPLRAAGLSLDFSLHANGGFSAFLSEAPWFWSSFHPVYGHLPGAKLDAALSLDIRFSPSFRSKASFAFAVPAAASVSLTEFFLDYDASGAVFFRAGKFRASWGISPNFPAASLPARLPPGNTGGDPYVFKADIPLGIGGFQLLALTRPGFMANKTAPALREIGYGAKYNLALPRADIDTGLFFHQQMPLRAFLSLKSTLLDTELYLEGMASVRHESFDGFTVSAAFGFLRDFAGRLLSLNAEVFWNGEENAFYFSPKTTLVDEAASPFIPGLNAALNFTLRPPRLPGSTRLVFRALWAPASRSAHLTPALVISPLPHLSVSLAVPLALGPRDGPYYRSNHAPNNSPAALVLLFSLSSSFRLFASP